MSSSVRHVSEKNVHSYLRVYQVTISGCWWSDAAVDSIDGDEAEESDEDDTVVDWADGCTSDDSVNEGKEGTALSLE